MLPIASAGLWLSLCASFWLTAGMIGMPIAEIVYLIFWFSVPVGLIILAMVLAEAIRQGTFSVQDVTSWMEDVMHKFSTTLGSKQG